MHIGLKKTQFGIVLKIIVICLLSLFSLKNIHNFGAFSSLSKLNSCSVDDEKIKRIYDYLLKNGYADGQISVSTNNSFKVCSFGFEKGYVLRPIKDNSEFLFASLTKVLVGAELLHLDKNIGEQKIVTVLPELTAQDRNIQNVTVENLLAHRAGILQKSESGFFSKQPNCLILPNIKWLELGEVGAYNYSNISYCLLGQILEREKKLTLGQIFASYDFKMTDVNYSLLEQNGFILDKWANDGIYPKNLKGAGGVVGSSQTYHSFIRRRFFQDHILDLVDRDYMCKEFRCPNLLFYRIKKGNNYTYWRNGSLPYVTNLLVIFPDGRVITVFLNKRESNWLDFTDKLANFINFIY